MMLWKKWTLKNLNDNSKRSQQKQVFIYNFKPQNKKKIKNMYNDEDKKMWAYKGVCDNIIRFQQREFFIFIYISSC